MVRGVIKMDNQTKNLIAIGTSVGANCQPCLKYLVDKARGNGVNEQEIREAIEVANMVKKGASSKMDEFAQTLLEITDACKNGSEKACGCSLL